MAVARIAANASAGARVLFVDLDPERHVKGLQSGPLEIVRQMLNPLLVADRRIFVRRAGPRLGRIFAAGAMYLIEMFGLRVVRLELGVTDGPSRRDAAVMTDLAKVFLAQTKQRRAVKLCIPADVIIRVRMQLFSVFVAP